MSKTAVLIMGCLIAAGIGIWAAVDEIRTSRKEEAEAKKTADKALEDLAVAAANVDLTDVNIN